MIKLTALYGHPTDPAAFEKYYAVTHMPLVAKPPPCSYESRRSGREWLNSLHRIGMEPPRQRAARLINRFEQRKFMARMSEMRAPTR